MNRTKEREEVVIKMKKRLSKGEYLYLKEKKKAEILKTVCFFGISLALYLIGYITTGSNKNYLTIIAVLGFLPASKSAVSMIMNLRVKGCSEVAYEKISKVTEEGAYNLFFTTYDKNYDLSHIYVKGMTVIGFTETKKANAADFEEHIKVCLKRDGIEGVNIKLYGKLEDYLTRVGQMQKLENVKSREKDIMKTLYAVSL